MDGHAPQWMGGEIFAEYRTKIAKRIFRVENLSTVGGMGGNQTLDGGAMLRGKTENPAGWGACPPPWGKTQRYNPIFNLLFWPPLECSLSAFTEPPPTLYQNFLYAPIYETLVILSDSYLKALHNN